MFMIVCALIKMYIRVVYVINGVLDKIARIVCIFTTHFLAVFFPDSQKQTIMDAALNMRFLTIADGLCPDLENWYFAPTFSYGVYEGYNKQWVDLLKQTLKGLISDKNVENVENTDNFTGTLTDKTSIDYTNNEKHDLENPPTCITIWTDYLVACIEMALAQEYKVINFDFYNDWVNGVIYIPRWMRFVRAKRTFFFGLVKIKSKIRACMDDTTIFAKTRYYTQQCALSYGYENENKGYTRMATSNGCGGIKTQKCHKRAYEKLPIFGGSKTQDIKGNGGIVHENETVKREYVYYLKPCEWTTFNGKKVNLFATDIVLLGSLVDCNLYGIPQAYKYLTSSSYIMPTNLALTNMDDEGYLYTDNGTICSDRLDKTKINTEKRVTLGENNFLGELKYHNNGTEFSYGNFDDSIPLTEAAGIAWNYTGPGQGKPSTNITNSFYMPGGHFLGISCINSETNIKTCVNLERICEMGSNISQRREEIRKIVGNTNQLQYTYFIPTGLISNDDVNGGTFRTMFATMNQRRLLCNNRVDDKTGYPIYDFLYLRANGFNGSLKYRIKDDIFGSWNVKIDVEDEREKINEQQYESFIEEDVYYDKNEVDNTYARTIEESKMDYYKFRLGIDSLNNIDEQNKKKL